MATHSEWQIKTIMKYHLLLVRTVTFKTTRTVGGRGLEEEGRPLPCLGECELVTAQIKGRFLKILQTGRQQDLALSLLGLRLDGKHKHDMNPHPLHEVHTEVFTLDA